MAIGGPNKLDQVVNVVCFAMGVSSDDGVSEPTPPAVRCVVPPTRRRGRRLAAAWTFKVFKLEKSKLG